eukprot:maker-scaffold_5-snap-gene-11.51-mRNA-1 protein AED:0.00 eAED:0.00 QI:34/1/1/1/1/1/2/83/480
MKIRQSYFDDVVMENMKDFEMEKEEAVLDAIEQFKQKDVDLSEIITTLAGLNTRSEAEILFSRLEEINMHEAINITRVEELLRALISLVDGRKEQAANLSSHGAVGFACLLVRKIYEGHDLNQLNMLKLALKFLQSVLGSEISKEVLPKEGIKCITDVILSVSESQYKQNIELLEELFKSLLLSIRKCERNKVFIDEDHDFQKGLYAVAEKQKEEVIPSFFKFISIYVQDDDWRPGVQPNNYKRARLLVEKEATSLLVPLIKTVRLNTNHEANEGARKLLITQLSTLQWLLVNDDACMLAHVQGLTLTLVQILSKVASNLQGNRRDETCLRLLGNIFLTLKSLSRNDVVKSKVGNESSFVLETVNHLLQSIERKKTLLPGLQLLATLSLRHPENCQKMFNTEVFITINQILKTNKEENDWKLQVQAINVLRNLVSSAYSKHLIQPILATEAPTLIKQAKENYPQKELQDSAYAALRDLGL